MKPLFNLTKLWKFPQSTNQILKEAEILLVRGLAKKEAGKNGYIKDIKDAAKLGDKKAKTLLGQMA